MNEPDCQIPAKVRKPRGRPISSRKEGKRRSRLSRVAIPPKTRFEILQRDDFTCRYCGGRAPEVALQIDHITAVANGGRNTHENLVTACLACNSGKSDVPLSSAGLIQAGRIEDSRSQASSDSTCDLDGKDFLRHLCSKSIRLHLGNGPLIFSIGEIVSMTLKREGDVELIANEGQLALARIGIAVDVGTIAVANRSRELALLLRESKWELGWRASLRMIKGAKASSKPIYFFPGLFSRATSIPIDALWSTLWEAG